MNDSTSTQPGGGNGCDCERMLAFFVLRGWLAVRAIMTGVEKFGAYKTIQKPLVDPVTGMEDPSGAMVDVKIKFYAVTNDSGVPPVFKDKFANAPLLPHVALASFDHFLGPALIATGIMLLLGLGTRIALGLQGLIYIMLTVGLIMIHQDDGVAWLGIHIALVAFALLLARYNKLAVLKKW
jgi:thiosulfate dehydrogenase [quinone] large subunit